MQEAPDPAPPSASRRQAQQQQSRAEETGMREGCWHVHNGGLTLRMEEKHFMSEFYQIFEEHVILLWFKLFKSIKN